MMVGVRVRVRPGNGRRRVRPEDVLGELGGALALDILQGEAALGRVGLVHEHERLALLEGSVSLSEAVAAAGGVRASRCYH